MMDSDSQTHRALGLDSAYLPFGLDLTARNESVKPGDDFFEFANGGYLARTPIPADRSSATRRDGMSDNIEARLRSILEAAARVATAAPTSAREKVGAFYASFMDEASIERAGFHAIQPELSAIRSADRGTLAGLMGKSVSGLYASPFFLRIDADQGQPERYAVYLSQSGLGLPDVDYYKRADFADQRAAYQDYASRLLSLINWPRAELSTIRAVIDFETRVAQASWTRVEQRDPTTQYNPVTVADLRRLEPEFHWREYFDAAQISEQHVLVAAQKSAIAKIASAVAATPLVTLKAWMAFRVVDYASPYLSKEFVDARFEMREKVLAGLAEQPPRWKRGIAAVCGSDCSYAPHSCFGTLKWAVGQLYVERYFTAAAKAKIESLVATVKAAFRRRMLALDWMSAMTKAAALKKLDAYIIKVGYPDKWPGYEGAVIRRDDLVGNVRAAAEADWALCIARSKGPVDRGEWLLTPHANNAYSGSLRDVVFPAGILQAPIFDAAADPAVNYGAAGAVIAHELTHGFDDEGRATDANGELRDWWSAADSDAFNVRAAALGEQYAKYEPVIGVHIDPGLTMGENLADLGGLSIALDAYRASLNGKAAPLLAGLTGDQRVFLGWAQAWAGTATPEEIRRSTTSAPHSYRKYRVNGVVRNIDAWYTAFGVKPEDALYLPADKRVRVW